MMNSSLKSHTECPECWGLTQKFCTTSLFKNSSEIGLEDFKQLVSSKDPFFAERVFRIWDKDGSNGISPSEMRSGLELLCSQSVEDRVRFLFRIYDIDGDGLIQLHDIKEVLRACSKENAMIFSDEQLDQLAVALYEDAVDSVNDVDRNACNNGLRYEHLKAQLDKHPGLLNGLSLSLVRSLSTKPQTVKQNQPKSKFYFSYIRNNAAFLAFLVAYILVNLGLLISRAIQFKNENPLYISARMFGQALNFNCAFVIVLMLRRCITWLRQTQITFVLPLDHHVYFHKLCGIVIAVFASFHTVMHLINFPLNIANELISNVTQETHSAIEWLFTMKPGMFGLIPGIANPTGWGLLVILIVMIPFCLPFVRRSGYFELFYRTHLLYYPFFGLLILHGPHCWYWLVGPVAIFILLEKFVRFRRRQTGEGKSYVNYAVLLPSRVTHLVCRKPANFHFHPGDYVYVNIPGIASYEWHPFTISSAPEHPGDLWLHIRCAGGWTNKLYEYFKQEQIKHATTSDSSQMTSQSAAASQHVSIAVLPNPWTAVNFNVKKTNDDEDSMEEKNNASIKRRISRTQSLTYAGYRYMRHPPEVINFPVPTTQSSDYHITTIPKIQPNQGSFLFKALQVSKSCPFTEGFQEKDRKVIDQVCVTLPRVSEGTNEQSMMEETQNCQQQNQKTKSSSKLTQISLTPEKLQVKYSSPYTKIQSQQAQRKQATNQSSVISTNQSLSIISGGANSNCITEGIEIHHPLEITIDGPYGTPSSHIFRAEHAVLIAAGIGVTPFASILQSIMHRYYTNRQACPRCQHEFTSHMPNSIMNLKKVDFFWINRDQRSFEWFVQLLSQLEMEQAEMGGVMDRFLDLHMYITSALEKTDMKAIGLQMALDLLHAKEKRDLVTGLKTRTNAGRPNWNKVFQKLAGEGKGEVTVFYCGPPQLAKTLKEKCIQFGFQFRKEIF